MGGGASRAAGRAVAVARPAREAIDSLQHLPANSSVRRDAEAAIEMEKKRMELETIDVPLEELSGKDEEMVSLMKSAMKRPDGEITYKEHVLPITEETSMLQTMVSEVKSQQTSTDKLFAAREASEEEGAGRVNHEQFIAVMKRIQANRGSEEVLQQLSKEYSCDVKALRDVAEHISLPTVLKEAMGENFSRTAQWQ